MRRALLARFDNFGMTRKMLLPVVLAVFCLLAVAVTGLTGLASLNQSAQRLVSDGVRPLSALGSVRDAEGDSRLAVRAYLEAGDAKVAAAARAGVKDADAYMSQALAGYQADHVVDPDRAALAGQFTTAFAHWQSVRDTVVFPLVASGRHAAAFAAAAGELDAADADFAGPLDKLYEAETAAAGAVAGQARSAAATGRTQLLLIVALGLLLPAALAAWVARRTVRGLRHVGEVLDAVAAGRLTEHAQLNSTDEVGTMADRLNRTTSAFRGSVAAIADSSAELAANARQLTAVSERLSTATEQASTQTHTVSRAAAVVSSNVEAAASGAHEMNAAIAEIARSATTAATVTAQAVDSAHRASTAIGALGDSSAEIGTIVKVITSIAEQTNLLALNATIEAARAGDAGKGFAVVASEVKDLAQATARATEDIAQRIQTLQGDSTAAAAAITEIDEVISEINSLQATLASAVEEQTATTAEISRNVSETAAGTGEIATAVTVLTQTMTGVDEEASQAAASAEGLNRMSHHLQGTVAGFQV
jgi:methyl-accepting chemotaxis protein